MDFLLKKASCVCIVKGKGGAHAVSGKSRTPPFLAAAIPFTTKSHILDMLWKKDVNL
jgi:hypothetical protein